MIIKVGRNEIDLDENDVIMHNGACYQITTRLKRDGWYEHPIKIANGTAEKLIKKGELVKLREESMSGIPLTYYGINLPGEETDNA